MTTDEPARPPYVPPDLLQHAKLQHEDFVFMEPIGSPGLLPDAIVDFVFPEPPRPEVLTPADWWAEVRAMTLRPPPRLSEEYFEFLEDQAYVHLPGCPRLVDRPCEWCADEGVILTSEVLRRERAVQDLIPDIARVTLP